MTICMLDWKQKKVIRSQAETKILKVCIGKEKDEIK